MNQEFLPIVVTPSNPEAALAIPQAAEDIKKEIMALAVKVLKVQNVEDQQFAVNIAAQLKRLLKESEAVRKSAGDPYRLVVESVNAKIKGFIEDPKAHLDRIQRMLDGYQEEIEAERRRIENDRIRKIHDAENARLKAEIDAQNAKNKKQREEAQKKLEEAKKLESKANLDLDIVPAVANNTYGRSKTEWRISDLLAFANEYPNLVNIEPKAALINQMTSQGVLKTGKNIQVWQAQKAVVKV